LQDGGFIVSASSESTDGDVHSDHKSKDFWIFKINSTGAVQWDNKYGGADDDIAYVTRAMPDGSYYSGGFTESYDADASGNHGLGDALLLNLGTIPLSHTITTANVTPLPICWGQPVAINYTLTGTYNPGNIFTAQMSDNNGSFVNETPIGSIASVNPGTINTTIPTDFKNGSLYYIRVVSSDPFLIGGAYTSNLKLKCDAPKGLKSVNITSSSATLSWQSGTCPLKYIILWRIAFESDWDTAEVTTTSVTITGLTPGIEYQWKVQELCSMSPELFSLYSKPAFFTTAPLKSGDPQSEMTLSEVIIFPNPANQVLNIRYSTFPGSSGKGETKNGVIVITNLLGETVFTQNNIAAEMKIDVAPFAAGIYLIHLQTDKEILTKTFVKQ
jgi:hypothetical protein